MERVCSALKVQPRPMPEPNLDRLRQQVEGTDYRLPAHRDAHALALDPISRTLALGGSLYPDHVIFLGPGVVETAVIPPACTQPMLILPDGIVLRRSATAAADAMAKCLADVLARVPAGSYLMRLTATQDDELTHWEAEKYRQTLNLTAQP